MYREMVAGDWVMSGTARSTLGRRGTSVYCTGSHSCLVINADRKCERRPLHPSRSDSERNN